MGSILPFNVKGQETERFVLNNSEIPGVQSINLEYSLPLNPFTYLGAQETKFELNNKQVGNVNISNLIVSDDYFIEYTGSYGFNGYILENRPLDRIRKEVSKSYDVNLNGFISGYMTNYNQSCTIGEIPRTNIDIVVFKHLGLLNTKKIKEANDNYVGGILNQNINNKIAYIPNYFSIDLNLEEIQTNQILSYSFDISIPRESIYVPGKRFPVSIINPSKLLEVNFTIEALINDLQMINLSEGLIYNKQQNISLSLKDLKTNNTIKNYSFDNMVLSQFNKNSSVGNLNSATLIYTNTYIHN